MGTVKSELTLKLNLQGGRGQAPITVELRGATRPHDLVESVNGMGGGNVASVIWFENVGDRVPYYVVVKGANTLETWSATPITFNAHATSYDFTTATSQAYGNNQILFNGIPSMYRGDTNQDGIVDLSDVIAVYNDSTSFASHSSTDIDGDGLTDLTDIIATYDNATSFVAVMRPD